MQAWHVFQLVTKRWEDHKTKEPRFEIDWAAVDVVFAAYGVEEKRQGIEQIFKIINLISHPKELTPEQLFGWDEDE